MEIILKNRLKAEAVRAVSEAVLTKHLSLEVEGHKLTTEMALNVLMKAAIEQRSIEAVCADLTEVVDSNTLREALNRELTVVDLRQHETEFNEALADCIPPKLARRGLEMAIDFHDEPFYGKSAALRAYTVRGEAREGTTYLWRIATLYVIWRGVRVTLALTYVLPTEKTLTILQRLLQRCADLGVRPKVLYLDKGFASGKIIAYLQDDAKWPAIIACPIRGEEGGTRALCRGRKAYRTRLPSLMARPPTWRLFPPSNASRKPANRSAFGWSMSLSIWIGLLRRFSTAIAVALALSRPTANLVRCALIPIPATPPCGSSSWPWPCC